MGDAARFSCSGIFRLKGWASIEKSKARKKTRREVGKEGREAIMLARQRNDAFIENVAQLIARFTVWE